MSTLVVQVERLAVSFRVRVRTLVVMAVLVVVLAAAGVASLMVSRSGAWLTPSEVLAAIGGQGEGFTNFAVTQIRAPRVVASILTGFALGVSGAIFQSIARNGLVSPDIIGVTSGASLAALVVIVLGTQATGAGDSFEVPLSWIAPAALIGAFGATIAVYLLAYRKGLSPYRLILVGIGLTAVLDAGIAYGLTLTRFPFATELAFRWTIGNLYGTDWTEVGPGLVAFAIIIVLALFVVTPLIALGLGDDTAVGLGSRVEFDRLKLIVVGVCLAAIAVAIAGPIGFVAFIAPHIARALLHISGPTVIFASGFIGAGLTLIADMIAQHALENAELPIGAITALIGAPYFLFLLYRTNRFD